MAEKAWNSDDDAILGELGIEVKPQQRAEYTQKEERIIAGFEDIQRFVEEHGSLPRHGEGRDIFERIYAVRLDRMLDSEEMKGLLRAFDTTGILDAPREPEPVLRDDLSDDDILDALGVEPDSAPEIGELKHVRPRAEIKAAEEIAQRTRCQDFDAIFKKRFAQVQAEIDQGLRKVERYENNAGIEQDEWFILDGQKVLVDQRGDEFISDYGKKDRRLRVIYSNGTESNILLRSLQRALYKDPNGRRILPLEPPNKPLFSDDFAEGDVETGHLYVLRSLSEHPFIKEHRQVIHKIGITRQPIETRIRAAKTDPTFLLADVEVVASYQLANINVHKLEQLIHTFFSEARMDLSIKAQFGNDVTPKEWFMVPLDVIQEAVRMLIDGSLIHHRYDPDVGQITPGSAATT